MRIDGEWSLFSDGATRPVLMAEIAGGDGRNVGLRMLVDSGADCTVLSADLLARLNLPSHAPPPDTRIQGIGGECQYVVIHSVLEFKRNDGGPACVRGEFLALTDPLATDLSVLGRDVLDNFDLILSRSRGEVLLLAPRHQYQVTWV